MEHFHQTLFSVDSGWFQVWCLIEAGVGVNNQNWALLSTLNYYRYKYPIGLKGELTFWLLTPTPASNTILEITHCWVWDQRCRDQDHAQKWKSRSSRPRSRPRQGKIEIKTGLEPNTVRGTRMKQRKNYTGAPGDFAPEMQIRALENQKRAPENCHRLQCKSLFNVADLVNGMWKVAPENKNLIFGLEWECLTSLTNLESPLPPEGHFLAVDIDHFMAALALGQSADHRFLLKHRVSLCLELLEGADLAVGSTFLPRDPIALGWSFRLLGECAKDVVWWKFGGGAWIWACAFIVPWKARICGWWTNYLLRTF